MKKFTDILEEEDVIKYLEKRNLLKQYIKIKNSIISWNYWKSDLKQRQPKWTWVWSFRINKQFRAFWYEREWKLIIVDIDNHQK